MSFYWQDPRESVVRFCTGLDLMEAHGGLLEEDSMAESRQLGFYF